MVIGCKIIQIQAHIHNEKCTFYIWTNQHLYNKNEPIRTIKQLTASQTTLLSVYLSKVLVETKMKP